jgi:hypothetical protein
LELVVNLLDPVAAARDLVHEATTVEISDGSRERYLAILDGHGQPRRVYVGSPCELIADILADAVVRTGIALRR